MRRQTVQKTLFFSYFIPILITIIILSLLFFTYTSGVLRNSEEKNLADVTDKLVSLIDSQISRINNLSLNITNSALLKEQIRKYNRLMEEGYPPESREIYIVARDISNILSMIAGPIKAVPQINFIGPGELMIGTGTYNLIADLPPETAEALEGIDTNFGKRHFSKPLRDPHAEKALPLYKNQRYVSLFRTIFDDYKNEAIGIIEVKQFEETIFYGFSKTPQNFIVFDGDYNKLYPYTNNSARPYSEMLKAQPSEGIISFRNSESGAKEILSIVKCREINWTIINIAQEASLLRPVYKFLLIILISGIVMFFISISVARRLSSLITQSLQQLNGWISNLHWNNLSAETPADLKVLSPLAEFEEIHREFWKMNKKLAESMKLVVQERSLQENARMLALQAQMDPHFMYNMLTTISIMAEDGETDNIVETISRLTSIIRYTASRSRLSVHLEEEIEITRNYLECMKIRFGDDLLFDINTDSSLCKLTVPKLIILPFVENSIKYATGGEPPWKIRITAAVSDNRWQLTVSDSGPGFSYDALEKINKMISCCDEDAQNQLNFQFRRARHSQYLLEA